MESENISINETAYFKILAIKHPEETISEVIIRLCRGYDPDILTYLNAIPFNDRVAIVEAALKGKNEMDCGYVRENE
jgi:predicted CopG family antitoxin